MSIALVPVASPLHDPQILKEIMTKVVDLVSRINKDIVIYNVLTQINDVNRVSRDHSLLIVPVLTGGTEHIIYKLTTLGLPIALIAHKSSNSLAAALEVKAKLMYEGYPAELFLLGSGIKDHLEAFIKASETYKELKKLKVLLIGDPSPWLIYSSLNLRKYEEVLGIKIVKVSIDEILSTINEVDESEFQNVLESLLGVKTIEPKRNDLLNSLRLYIAIKKLALRYNSKLITIRCFDLISHGVTACLPLSLLNDEGIVAGCEGDIPAALTMYILSKLSGKPTFMGNIVWVEDKDILLAHCTVALKLVGSFIFRSHFESGIGLSIEGYPIKGLIITIARLDMNRDELRVSIGRIMNTEPLLKNRACRTQFLIRFEGNPKYVINESIGNHYVIAVGDVRKSLKYLALMLKLKYIEF
ncbi:MAG: hypothetical protein B6U85_02975 [Desulfurococcales archaeon ex4484_42]|nr:MAG: hypothetical protein B6U85_02975 [Desulfurococcales archaeon ex4484_42]